MDGVDFMVELLVRDPRVNVTLADNRGCTPLWNASRNGFLEVIEWLIACGRDLGDLTVRVQNWRDGRDYTAAEVARENEWHYVAELLDRFVANPAETRHEVLAVLGVLDEKAAYFFAVTIFLCDELLQLTPALTTSGVAAVRFFTIALKLPIELQMVLSRRAAGSMTQNILSVDSKVAFKSLAASLILSQPE